MIGVDTSSVAVTSDCRAPDVARALHCHRAGTRDHRGTTSLSDTICRQFEVFPHASVAVTVTVAVVSAVSVIR